MKCSRCAREIPDGSRFCGLCGGKQTSADETDPKAQTLVGAGAASTLAARGRAATLVGGLASEVVAGGRRFAALSAGPAAVSLPRPTQPGAAPTSLAPDDAASAVTDTLSEGVPAGAMAALLAARRAKPAANTKALDAQAPVAAPPAHTAADASTPADRPAPGRARPRGPAATLVGSPALSRSLLAPDPQTEPDRPAVELADEAPATDETAESLPPAPADLLQTEPALAAARAGAIDQTEQSLPPAAADLVAQLSDPPAAAPIDDAVLTLKRRRRVRPVVTSMPSVIVDSEFGREAKAVEAELSRPPSDPSAPVVEASAPPARVEAAADTSAPMLAPAAAAGEAAAQKPGKGGFRETAWFLDALDAETLSRAETDDIRARQAQHKAGIDRANQLDERTRRQYSLRSNDSLPALGASAVEVDADAPASAERQSPLVGLLIFVVLALGVAGWFLFGR